MTAVGLLEVGVAGVLGLVVGSYAVTAGLRFSRGEAATFGRSRCDACGITLGLARTVPVLSYLGTRGRCAGCRSPIDIAHILGEVIGAGVCVSAAWIVGGGRGLVVAGLGLILIPLAVVDLKTQRLPNGLTAATAALGFLLAATAGWPRLVEGLAAATLLAVVLLGMRSIVARDRSFAGLGLGDVKLACGLALWLGAATPIFIFLASAFGLVAARRMRDRGGRIPFGPFLAAAGWAVGVAIEGGWSPWAL